MVHHIIKISCVLGMTAMLATHASAQTANGFPPIPGPFQSMLPPMQPLQPQLTRNNPQALPYWMQPAPAQQTQAVPRGISGSSGGSGTSNTAKAQPQVETKWGLEPTSIMTMQNMQRNMPTPGFFPGYRSQPNRTGSQVAATNFAGQPQFRQYQPPRYGNPDYRNWSSTMANFGPYYGQLRSNWAPNNGGFNPAFRPPNGYVNWQNFRPYGQPPRQ